jgi:hypothetical protein
MNRLRHARRSVVAAALLTVLVTGTTLAAPPLTLIRKGPIDFAFVDTQMCGFPVEISFLGTVTRTNYIDADGNVTRTVANVVYTSTFAGPSETLSGKGTRHIVIDWVSGIQTESGAYRAVTSQGDGMVLLDTGRLQNALDNGAELLFEAGFHEDWYLAYGEICEALAG